MSEKTAPATDESPSIVLLNLSGNPVHAGEKVPVRVIAGTKDKPQVVAHRHAKLDKDLTVRVGEPMPGQAVKFACTVA